MWPGVAVKRVAKKKSDGGSFLAAPVLLGSLGAAYVFIVNEEEE